MKKAKTEDGIDRICMLPDLILHRILSPLQTIKLVDDVSFLSKRWMNLWTSVPSIRIECYSKPTFWATKDELNEFVYWVFLNHKSSYLDSFTLDCSAFGFDMATISRWIRMAVKRKVKKIDLKFTPFNPNEPAVLPTSLRDYDSLEMFTLNLLCCSLSLKWFTGSNTLKVLRLDCVELLDEHLVQSFFTNFLLLEELSLVKCITGSIRDLVISCMNLKVLRIDNRGLLDSESFVRYNDSEENKLSERLTVVCPKLVSFAYGGHMARHFSFDVKSLKKAVIELEDVKLNGKADDNFGVSMCELFAQVSHVEYLSINRFFHQSKSERCQCCNLPNEGFLECLPCLKKLELKLDSDFMVVL